MCRTYPESVRTSGLIARTYVGEAQEGQEVRKALHSCGFQGRQGSRKGSSSHVRKGHDGRPCFPRRGEIERSACDAPRLSRSARLVLRARLGVRGSEGRQKVHQITIATTNGRMRE